MDSIYYLNAFVNNNLVRGLFFMLLTVLSAYLVDYLIWYYFKKITLRTNNKIDDFLINVLTTPIHWFIILIGFRKSLLLTLKWPLSKQINLYFTIIMVAIIAIVVSKILTFIIKRWLKSYKNTKTIPQYIGNIVSVVIFIIAIAVVLSILDISISPILTSLGIAGLVIGLSLQSTLINIIAAIKIISEEKVKIGDYIDDGGAIKGVVEDISLNSTRIRNLNNNIIIVPNAKISDSAVINYARNESKIRIIVPVAISTDLPIDKIKSQLVEIVKDIFKNHEGTYKKREPEVWLNSAEYNNALNLPIYKFNILINIVSYRYEFNIMDAILTKVSQEFWDKKIKNS